MNKEIKCKNCGKEFQQKNSKHIFCCVKCKDECKHNFILDHYNINILYLWEYDINNDINLCWLLIKKYIDNNGELPNYNSFNYHKLNDEVYLK